MKYFDYKKAVGIVAFPAVVFVIHELINIPFGLYDVFPALDIPMHFLGGASVSVSSALCLRQTKGIVMVEKIGKFFFFLWAVSLAGLAAIVWEFYEFLSDYFFQTVTQPSLADTVGDLFFGLVGGLVASAYIVYRWRQIKK